MTRASAGNGLGPPPAYARFVLLSGARTGSTMFAYALNSHPQARCFGELFNYTVEGAIDYLVDGYDKWNADDLALRSRDAVAFLRQRIFCEHGGQVRAVGLKYHYLHFFGFPGALDSLTEADDIRVLHLKRRNLLRMLVSLKMAYETGSWKRERPQPMVTPRKVTWSLLHPLAAVQRLRTKLAPATPSPTPETRPAVTISPQELYAFIDDTEHSRDHYDELFAAHPRQDVFFEDLEMDAQRAFAQAQDFLGLPRRHLRVALERQNPHPLTELIDNYAELEAAFARTPHAWMFD